MFVLKETASDPWLLGLVAVMSIVANLPVEFTSWVTIEKDYLLMGLAVIVTIALVRYVRLGLVLVILVLVIGANLPQEMATRFGIDPLIMLGTLVLIAAIPLLNRFMKLLPTGMEQKHAATTTYGAKALFSSVLKGDVKSVQSLIDSGVNVNIRTVSGKTVLMAAASRGYADITQILVSAGSSINAQDNQGNTALNIAKRMGFSRTVALLTIAGAKA